MKHLVAILASVALCTALAGCGGDDVEPVQQNPQPEVDESAPSQTDG